MFDSVPAESGNAGGAKEVKDFTKEFCCSGRDVLVQKTTKKLRQADVNINSSVLCFREIPF